MGQEVAGITSRRICCCVVTHQKLRRDVISVAPGQAEPLTGVWQQVTIGDNKNTAYCHPLFIYNQRVIARVADVTTKSKKKRFNKFGL